MLTAGARRRGGTERAWLRAAAGSGGSCSLSDIVTRASIGPTGLTGDGRWNVSTADLAVSAGGGPPTLSGVIVVSGIAGRDPTTV